MSILPLCPLYEQEGGGGEEEEGGGVGAGEVIFIWGLCLPPPALQIIIISTFVCLYCIEYAPSVGGGDMS